MTSGNWSTGHGWQSHFNWLCNTTCGTKKQAGRSVGSTPIPGAQVLPGSLFTLDNSSTPHDFDQNQPFANKVSGKHGATACVCLDLLDGALA